MYKTYKKSTISHDRDFFFVTRTDIPRYTQTILIGEQQKPVETCFTIITTAYTMTANNKDGLYQETKRQKTTILDERPLKGKIKTAYLETGQWGGCIICSGSTLHNNGRHSVNVISLQYIFSFNFSGFFVLFFDAVDLEAILPNFFSS